MNSKRAHDNISNKEDIKNEEDINPLSEKKIIDHGKNIAWYREAAGYSKTQFAKLAVVSVQAVSKWELSKELSDSILHKAAKALNIGIEWLRDRQPSDYMKQYSVNGNNNTNFFNTPYLTYNHYPLDKLAEAYDKNIFELKENQKKIDSVYKNFIEKHEKLSSDYIDKLEKQNISLKAERDKLMEKIFNYIGKH